MAQENKVGNNCIDTTLFIVGAIHSAKIIDAPKVDLLTRLGMVQTDKLEPGVIVQVIYDTYSGIGWRVAHMGVIVDVNPRALIGHRLGDGDFKTEDLNNFVTNAYSRYPREHRIEYYFPRHR